MLYVVQSCNRALNYYFLLISSQTFNLRSKRNLTLSGTNSINTFQSFHKSLFEKNRDMELNYINCFKRFMYAIRCNNHYALLTIPELLNLYLTIDFFISDIRRKINLTKSDFSLSVKHNTQSLKSKEWLAI